MSRIAYVNGRYLRHSEACVAIDDRGYQFADGVYEVIAVANGVMVDEAPHIGRLRKSLAALAIAWPMSAAALSNVLRETIRMNRVREGIVYLQITRGVARREHLIPNGLRPSVVVTARNQKRDGLRQLEKTGVAVISLPDLRWRRCDIKTTGLLANVLARNEARAAGAFEAWLIDQDGFVTEGTSTNAWIVDHKGKLITRQLENALLAGVTRSETIKLAARAGLAVVERKFSLAEAKAAREAFLTSTTSFVLPVVSIDGAAVGQGSPGPITQKLGALYAAHALGPAQSRAALP
jgi:D-alanine transaminase